MKFKALITDLDGTLVTLPIDWDRLRNEVRNLLNTDHPLRPLAPSIPEASRGNLTLIKKAFELIEREELRASESAEFDEELYRFFRWIKELGMKIGLVTLQGRRPAERTLKRLGILKFFDSIVTREDSLIRLEQLLKSLRKLNTKPEETIFVGDSPSDVKVGKTLNLFTVTIKKRTCKPKGDLEIDKITELRGYLEHF